MSWFNILNNKDNNIIVEFNDHINNKKVWLYKYFKSQGGDKNVCKREELIEIKRDYNSLTDARGSLLNNEKHWVSWVYNC